MEKYPGVSVHYGSDAAWEVAQMVFGRPMNSAKTPAEAVDDWLAEHSAVFGEATLDYAIEAESELADTSGGAAVASARTDASGQYTITGVTSPTSVVRFVPRHEFFKLATVTATSGTVFDVDIDWDTWKAWKRQFLRELPRSSATPTRTTAASASTPSTRSWT